MSPTKEAAALQEEVRPVPKKFGEVCLRWQQVVTLFHQPLGAGGEPRGAESLCVGRHRSVCCPPVPRNGGRRVCGVDFSNAKAQRSAPALQGRCWAIAKGEEIDLISTLMEFQKVAEKMNASL